MKHAELFAVAVFLAFSQFAISGQSDKADALSGSQIVERVSPSAVVILAGRGDGQVSAIGSGLIMRSDGVILTANHLVKGMQEVQVRLKNGEVYDHVELIATDERRDTAALRIPAVGLPVLPVRSAADVPPGSLVFLVSTGAGLPWTASSGIISALRMADEVPGAGGGYRLLQFTAPIAPGSSGGVLVDSQAHALGMVLGSLSAGQNLNFAVPIESVAGLATMAGGTAFASGKSLREPGAIASTPGTGSTSPLAPPAVPPGLSLPRQDQLLVRTLSVLSKTIYIRRERLQDDLRKTAMFQQLGLRFADYNETADVMISVDRPFLTFDWTYTIVFQPSGMTLASGSVEAVDEFDAGPKLAASIMDQLASAAVLPRTALVGSKPSRAEETKPRAVLTDPADVLRACQAIMVESHTIWMKGNLLQDALYVRPELREWGIRIVDDRSAADIYIDITRPFLTYDWVYKMINPRTGAVVDRGKVVAIDGSAAAQRLALEIVASIRKVRSLPSSEGH